jgi:hydrogenase maturation protease
VHAGDLRRKRIVCLGNELRGDDGVGVKVGRVLEQLELPQGTEVEILASAGLDLVDAMISSDLVVVVDALRTSTAAPGTCLTFEVDQPEGFGLGPRWSHGVGLPQVLQIARRMRPDLAPPKIVVIGVEIEAAERFETVLSGPVQQVFSELVEMVLRAVDAEPQLIQQAVDAARRFSGKGCSVVSKDQGTRPPDRGM